LVKKALSQSKYTIKSGMVVAKSGQILATPPGRTYWVDASLSVPKTDKERMMVDLKEKFDRYYSVQMSNYSVQDAYIPHPMVIRPQPFDIKAVTKEVA
jgi:formylmethanofuran dehydrogenase subunit A